MANIVIKDLKENIELDRKAMRAISGGKSGSTLSKAWACHSSTFTNPLSFNRQRFLPGNPDAFGGTG